MSVHATVVAMGIRYFAQGIRATDIEAAREHRRWALHPDPLRAIETAGEMPVLDLDKSWRPLQQLFGASAAITLVQGDVTHTDGGWIPHIAVLDPSQVGDLAVAIADFDECAVLEARLHWFGREVNSDEGELDAIMHYLRAAQEFAANLARNGHGLLYRIG